MKTLRIVTSALVRIALCLVFVYCAPRAASMASSAQAQARRYVCPPCGAPCDGATYDHPGACPMCGMKLVEEGTKAATATPGRPVAILVFDGAEIIDFTGPYEVFGAAGFDVYTVGQTHEPVTTAMGMKVVPKYAFDDAPQPSILVVPGGGVEGVRRNAPTLAWLSRVTGRADVAMSVCNGAFILGSAGLLDGLAATTTFHLLPRLASEFPRTKVVRDRRFVDNGKIVTTAGLSSGIDGALHVVERVLGKGVAQATALAVEYDWHRDSPFVRAALADRLVPDVTEESGTWTVETTEGSTERWDLAVRGTSTMSAADLMAYIGRGFTTKGKWRSVSSSPTSSDFRFDDEDGRPWTGTLAIEVLRAEAREYRVRLRIARAA